MRSKTKIGIAAGVCSTLIAGAAFGSANSRNDSVTLSLDRKTGSVVPTQTDTTPADSEYNIEGIGLSISFSACPEKSSNDMLTFVFDDPPFTVYVPTDVVYSCDDVLKISGIISEMEKDHLTLINAVISPSAPEEEQAIISDPLPQSTPQHTERTEAPQDNAPIIKEITVYLSSSGKYHRRPDCSGMKSYTEMTLSEAASAGYTPCKRCN